MLLPKISEQENANEKKWHKKIQILYKQIECKTDLNRFYHQIHIIYKNNTAIMPQLRIKINGIKVN